MTRIQMITLRACKQVLQETLDKLNSAIECEDYWLIQSYVRGLRQEVGWLEDAWESVSGHEMSVREFRDYAEATRSAEALGPDHVVITGINPACPVWRVAKYELCKFPRLLRESGEIL